jgi:hypothetical protein
MSAEPGLRQRRLRIAGGDTAQRALLAERLAEHDGVLALHWLGDSVLQIDYRLRDVQWDRLEALAAGIGVEPLNTFAERLRRYWLRFSDSVAREYLNRDQDLDYAISRIYVSRYRQRRHGRRDDRKHNWREYTPGQRQRPDS